MVIDQRVLLAIVVGKTLVDGVLLPLGQTNVLDQKDMYEWWFGYYDTVMFGMIVNLRVNSPGDYQVCLDAQ